MATNVKNALENLFDEVLSTVTETKPKLELIYFDARARGEIVRWVLAFSGAEWKETRVKREEWPALKPGLSHFLCHSYLMSFN